MGNPIFEAHFFLDKTLQFFFEQLSCMTLRKNCFQKQFWTPGSAQTRKCMKVKVQVFLFGHFPRFNLFSENNFYTKSYINTILKNLAFCPKKWHLKKWISHCILKMWFDHGRVKFWKSQTPQNMPKFWW